MYIYPRPAQSKSLVFLSCLVRLCVAGQKKKKRVFGQEVCLVLALIVCLHTFLPISNQRHTLCRFKYPSPPTFLPSLLYI